MRRFVKFAVATMLMSGSLFAQGNPARPAAESNANDQSLRFEVATIKPSKPDSASGPGQMGHRVTMPGTSVLFLIGFAYDLQDKQVVSAPAWAIKKKFDIDGVSGTPGDPDLEQIEEMLRNFLADRFQLRMHAEQRRMPAYVLSVTTSGPKLLASTQSQSSKPGLLMQPGFPKMVSMKESICPLMTSLGYFNLASLIGPYWTRQV